MLREPYVSRNVHLLPFLQERIDYPHVAVSCGSVNTPGAVLQVVSVINTVSLTQYMG